MKEPILPIQRDKEYITLISYYGCLYKVETDNSLRNRLKGKKKVEYFNDLYFEEDGQYKNFDDVVRYLHDKSQFLLELKAYIGNKIVETRRKLFEYESKIKSKKNIKAKTYGDTMADKQMPTYTPEIAKLYEWQEILEKIYSMIVRGDTNENN